MFVGLALWVLRRPWACTTRSLRAAYLPCRLAPMWGALTMSLDLASGALTAGAVFERIWLRTTRSIGRGTAALAAASAVLSCRPATVALACSERHWWGGWNLLARPLANDGLPIGHARRRPHNASIG